MQCKASKVAPNQWAGSGRGTAVVTDRATRSLDVIGTNQMTWRAHPFEKSHSYQVRSAFDGFPKSRFVPGNRYTFVEGTYSHYDPSTVFTFREEESGKLMNWWWHDDESDSLCAERFNIPMHSTSNSQLDADAARVSTYTKSH
jgi:hypothetical protein